MVFKKYQAYEKKVLAKRKAEKVFKKPIKVAKKKKPLKFSGANYSKAISKGNVYGIKIAEKKKVKKKPKKKKQNKKGQRVVVYVR